MKRLSYTIFDLIKLYNFNVNLIFILLLAFIKLYNITQQILLENECNLYALSNVAKTIYMHDASLQ
jgi:hypothetical protein